MINLNLYPTLNRWLLILGIAAYLLQPTLTSREASLSHPHMVGQIFQEEK